MAIEYYLALFIIFLLSFIFLGKWKGKNQPSYRFPPSLPSLPIVGSLPFLRGFDSIAKFFSEKSLELGPVFTFRAGSKMVLVLNNKEAIEEALVRNARTFSSRPKLYMEKLINPNTKGLVFKDVTPEWKRIHKNSLAILREFGFGDKNIMEERIMREVEAMVDFVKKTGGKPFDPKELFFLESSNVLMNILLGTRRDYDLGMSELIIEVDHYAHLLDVIFDIAPFLKYIPPLKRKIPEMKRCNKIIYDNVEAEIRKSLQSNKKCFVSEFIRREGPDYDRGELYFILRDFIAAGTDTTAQTMRWAMVAFANHPEIQKKLQEEIDSVISRDRYPTMQDQKKLPYLEATIHEVFRWRTMAPLSIAHYTDQDSIVKDFFIPDGTIVLPNLYAAHSDTTVWEDPDVFRPERFLDKEGNVFGLDRVISFSLGRRSCAGETLARSQIFLMITSFLQRFTVLPPEGQGKICDQPMQPTVVLQIPRSFSIRMANRQ